MTTVKIFLKIFQPASTENKETKIHHLILQTRKLIGGEIGVTEGILKDRMHDSQFVPPTAKKARTVLRTGWDR